MSLFDNLSEEARENLRQGLLALSRVAERHAEEMGAIYRKRHAEQLAEREEVDELERLYALGGRACFQGGN